MVVENTNTTVAVGVSVAVSVEVGCGVAVAVGLSVGEGVYPARVTPGVVQAAKRKVRKTRNGVWILLRA
jgi:hypothetical protein